MHLLEFPCQKLSHSCALRTMQNEFHINGHFRLVSPNVRFHECRVDSCIDCRCIVLSSCCVKPKLTLRWVNKLETAHHLHLLWQVVEIDMLPRLLGRDAFGGVVHKHLHHQINTILPQTLGLHHLL